jgi:hypothetical protein
MGVFPPWEQTGSAPGAPLVRRPAGYHFIAAPPAPQDSRSFFGVRIDLTRLLIQYVSLAALVGASMLVAGANAKNSRGG